MTRNWGKTACLFHLTLIKTLTRFFSWVPQSVELVNSEEESRAAGGFNLFCVFPLNYYQFNYSLWWLLFVSCCLITNLHLGEATHPILSLQLPQGWGCWATQLPWGTAQQEGLVGLPSLLPEPLRRAGAGGHCPVPVVNATAVLLCTRARRKHGRNRNLERFAP